MALNLDTRWRTQPMTFQEGPGMAIVGESGGKRIRFVMSQESAQQLADVIHDHIEALEN